MKITSPVVGEIEVSAERILQFPAGLPGFETCHQFTLIHSEGDSAPKLFVLQCLDDPEVAFTVTTPEVMGLNYEFALSDEEVAAIQLGSPEDIHLLLIVSKQGDSPVRANVMAPLVLNTSTRLGLQKVIGKVDTSVTLKAVD
ncbi:flagellar assembly protein FliW [Zoogloea sp.]|uniref:flagellar assembly protein FliW n=1 Tax=Zoogloea sp. TaxID=49181 RepID=UPI002637A3BA|nr:flagellar assembly protein FliW [Zoogloea sp.]MDD3354522.1 flagellar assembly protein FliW [Zoogloea sp.]